MGLAKTIAVAVIAIVCLSVANSYISHRESEKRVSDRQQAEASARKQSITYTEEDIYWDEHTKNHKRVVVAGVNKVARENEKCNSVDPGTATMSQSRGSPEDPVFFVMCEGDDGVFNAYFSKSAVEAGAVLSAPENIERGRAIVLCKDQVKGHVNNPSTVDFKAFSTSVTDHSNGNTTVFSDFSAQNDFGVESDLRIRCLLNAQGLIESSILQAG